LALKEIEINEKDNQINVTEAFEIAQEATTLATLKHPNIIQYYDSFFLEKKKESDESFFYIITEYCDVRF
jgi:serine/threonine protein kinase